MKTQNKGLTPEEIRKNSHWRKVMNTTYLNGDEIEKGDSIVTIASYTETMIYSQKDKQKEPQVLLYFKELDKPMILTNRKAKQITNSLDTEFMVDWIGKKVAMYAVKERHFGEDFEVITFKKAIVKKEAFNSKHKRWDGACKALKEGTSTVEAIEKFYTITAPIKKELEKIVRDGVEERAKEVEVDMGDPNAEEREEAKE